MTDGDTEELISLLDGILITRYQEQAMGLTMLTADGEILAEDLQHFTDIRTGDVFTFRPPTACKGGTLVLALRYAGRLHPIWATEGKTEGSGGGETEESKGGETEDIPEINKERVREMQEKVFPIEYLSIGNLQDTIYGTQGYIGVYNKRQVVIPAVTWRSNLDREARMHDRTGIFVCGVLIDRETLYDCYLVATRKGTRIPNPIAGIVKTLTGNTMTIVTATDEMTVTQGEGLAWGVGSEVIYIENGYHQHMVVPFSS